ncbi:hypothetical protein C8F04DRAFT_1187647 [Mycena alexandri]|uniref:Uncharacterized protein n=1 Tax=Mycena alexandri TaxID=1745969 RepID=A0AAD6SMX8_9AGAR|nr:hypothetical protein C8F04DRAFT_1187647 [Mycena alexandri]
MDAEPVPEAPESPKQCSQSKCKRPADEGKATCTKCRENNTRAAHARRAKRALEKEVDEVRKRARLDDAPPAGAASTPGAGGETDDECEEKEHAFKQFNGPQELFSGLRDAFKHSKHVNFRGTYQTPEDPLITDKERVQMAILELWKVTGYRFRFVLLENASQTCSGPRY